MSTPQQHIFKPKDKIFSTPLRPISTDKIVRTPLDPKVPDQGNKIENVTLINPEEPAAKPRRTRKSDET